MLQATKDPKMKKYTGHFLESTFLLINGRKIWKKKFRWIQWQKEQKCHVSMSSTLSLLSQMACRNTHTVSVTISSPERRDGTKAFPLEHLCCLSREPADLLLLTHLYREMNQNHLWMCVALKMMRFCILCFYLKVERYAERDRQM